MSRGNTCQSHRCRSEGPGLEPIRHAQYFSISRTSKMSGRCLNKIFMRAYKFKSWAVPTTQRTYIHPLAASRYQAFQHVHVDKSLDAVGQQRLVINGFIGDAHGSSMMDR
ncbi:hypothetical protein BDV28DRAFT_1642 [Aspergillus coremiiformis]|uniref:Uncharacterized protein n=1 Tax=Aspergillus coremiiformis TaxID=138285 RepID=A0A5N6ZHC3_9EURO|nr:hypothetical protein BDV28DRAFT_1642 [Aspergillus coremiiformis]